MTAGAPMLQVYWFYKICAGLAALFVKGDARAEEGDAVAEGVEGEKTRRTAAKKPKKKAD